MQEHEDKKMEKMLDKGFLIWYNIICVEREFIATRSLKTIQRKETRQKNSQISERETPGLEGSGTALASGEVEDETRIKD